MKLPFTLAAYAASALALPAVISPRQVVASETRPAFPNSEYSDKAVSHGVNTTATPTTLIKVATLTPTLKAAELNVTEVEMILAKYTPPEEEKGLPLDVVFETCVKQYAEWCCYQGKERPFSLVGENVCKKSELTRCPDWKLMKRGDEDPMIPVLREAMLRVIETWEAERLINETLPWFTSQLLNLTRHGNNSAVIDTSFLPLHAAPQQSSDLTIPVKDTETKSIEEGVISKRGEVDDYDDPPIVGLCSRPGQDLGGFQDCIERERNKPEVFLPTPNDGQFHGWEEDKMKDTDAKRMKRDGDDRESPVEKEEEPCDEKEPDERERKMAKRDQYDANEDPCLHMKFTDPLFIFPGIKRAWDCSKCRKQHPPPSHSASSESLPYAPSSDVAGGHIDFNENVNIPDQTPATNTIQKRRDDCFEPPKAWEFFLVGPAYKKAIECRDEWAESKKANNGDSAVQKRTDCFEPPKFWEFVLVGPAYKHATECRDQWAKSKKGNNGGNGS